MSTRIIIGLGTSACFAWTAHGNIYWHQRHDFWNRSPSEENTLIPSARTADDFFTIRQKFTLDSVTVSMIVSWPDPPTEFGVTFYLDRQGQETGPGKEIFFTDDVITTIDRGEWNGHKDLHLVDVIIDGHGAILGTMTYWLSPYAIGDGTGRAWWGTSHRGRIRESEGYFMSEHFGVPDWTPISQSGILDYPSDFAFTIESSDIPAPGAVALMIGGATFHRRRRRVS